MNLYEVRVNIKVEDHMILVEANSESEARDLAHSEFDWENECPEYSVDVKKVTFVEKLDDGEEEDDE